MGTSNRVYHFAGYTFVVLMVIGMLGVGQSALAGMAEVLEFEDEEAWIAAVGGEDAFTTIDFTGFPDNTFVTDQYADLGVLFTDGIDEIQESPVFVDDGWGLDGIGFNGTELTFTHPQLWLGFDFPGRLAIELYSDGELIYASELTQFGGGGTGWFAGVVSDTPFDQAIVFDPAGGTFIDNIHFGVPAPGAISVLALLGLLPSARRRHDHRYRLGKE